MRRLQLDVGHPWPGLPAAGIRLRFRLRRDTVRRLQLATLPGRSLLQSSRL
jgi:hypothetical protein